MSRARHHSVAVRLGLGLVFVGATLAAAARPHAATSVPALASAQLASAARNATESQTTATNTRFTDAARRTVAPSAGVAPSIAVEGPLPTAFDPVVHLTARLAGDHVIDGVRLGPTSAFPALGNDAGIDDCALVAVANIAAVDALRFGAPAARPTTAQAIAAWHILNGDTASGISDATVFGAWASPTAVLATHIAGWTSLDTAAERQLKAAIVNDGALYARLSIASDVPWTSLVWSHIPAATAAVQGHAVTLIGWTRSGWVAVSWGEVVLIPWSYWAAEGVAAYAAAALTTS